MYFSVKRKKRSNVKNRSSIYNLGSLKCWNCFLTAVLSKLPRLVARKPCNVLRLEISGRYSHSVYRCTSQEEMVQRDRLGIKQPVLAVDQYVCRLVSHCQFDQTRAVANCGINGSLYSYGNISENTSALVFFSKNSVAVNTTEIVFIKRTNNLPVYHPPQYLPHSFQTQWAHKLQGTDLCWTLWGDRSCHRRHHQRSPVSFWLQPSGRILAALRWI